MRLPRMNRNDMKRQEHHATFEKSEEISKLPTTRNSHQNSQWPKNTMRNEALLKNQERGRTRQRGFTLVEFLVSFTLVTLLITGTVQLTIHSLLVKRNADLNLKTAELASSFLEHIKSLPYESEELKEGFREEHVKSIISEETFRREWNVKDIDANLKMIEVECLSENRRFKKTRLVLYLSRELGF